MDKVVAALKAGVCDETAARNLCTLGSDTVALALHAAERRIAEEDAQLARLEAQAQNEHRRVGRQPFGHAAGRGRDAKKMLAGANDPKPSTVSA